MNNSNDDLLQELGEVFPRIKNILMEWETIPDHLRAPVAAALNERELPAWQSVLIPKIDPQMLVTAAVPLYYTYATGWGEADLKEYLRFEHEGETVDLVLLKQYELECRTYEGHLMEELSTDEVITRAAGHGLVPCPHEVAFLPEVAKPGRLVAVKKFCVGADWGNPQWHRAIGSRREPAWYPKVGEVFQAVADPNPYGSSRPHKHSKDTEWVFARLK